jgi:iron complex outermembrane receptor protein
MNKTICPVLLVALAGAACPAVAAAQAAPVNLADFTLEELMNVRVTSAARKSQRAEDVPTAIYVITQRDIQQSGLATLPEILRLAPGVQVAQVSASNWAISIRGFNTLYSNKLLVLVDGRSLYSRTFSGVLWDIQDVMVPDIDRIEVIRGPGGALWGANAVNGVINIITRPATETRGLAVDLSAGTFDRERAAVRFGGGLGATSYRVFTQWTGHADSAAQESRSFSDRWHSLVSGARMDWSHGADAFLAQGHFTVGRTRPGWLKVHDLDPASAPSADGTADSTEGSVLGRWTRARPSGTVLQVQGYHTSAKRETSIMDFTERSSDIDAQYETMLGARHGLVFGGGYRYVSVATDDTLTLHIGSRGLHTLNTFVQDEIAVREDVAVTVGSKVEYDTLGGWGLSPSARVMWEASAGQRLWAAVSRTRRTQALTDLDFRINLMVVPGPGLPIAIGVEGNPDYRSEELLQTEAGYRVRLGSTGAIDATVFTGSYDGLPTLEPLEPTVALTPVPHLRAGVFLANLMDARMSGLEVTARWTPMPRWQLESSYSFLHLTTEVDPASLDPAAPTADGSAPQHQWAGRTTVTVRPGVQFGASVSRVGRLRELRVPAYTRVDARAEFRLTGRLTAAIVGQNLSNGDHREFASDIVYLASSVPRSARLDLRWSF